MVSTFPYLSDCGCLQSGTELSLSRGRSTRTLWRTTTRSLTASQSKCWLVVSQCFLRNVLLGRLPHDSLRPEMAVRHAMALQHADMLVFAVAGAASRLP